MTSPRFSTTKALPDQLVDCDGRTITLHMVEGTSGGERLFAHRAEPTPWNYGYLAKATPPEHITASIARGFEVEAGSPSERIVRWHVARSYAVEIEIKGAETP